MRDALNKTSTQQFMKFAAVGIFSFVVDWLLLVILTEGFGIDYLVSTTVSFLVSVSLNYALSMKYVFEHRDDMSRKREFTIFAILSCIGLGLTDVLMFAGVTILNIAYQAMKVIATFCVTWYNFFTRKKFLSATN
ncbi:GtrA family protein [Enorma massiliensis]|uniref:GtrA family protein n=1 Tax=Enorma shizhengliae TaxID=2606615 RepID=A0A7K0G8Y9_9ACTN|nr:MULTISPECIES: GtrA family protein [Enorma]MBM6784194.1 GtrA family protein [Enorma massiliensis]MBM6892072.1 GtrA family protein [Enorma massiliensis]MRX79669.1 GtrA family protein [Enorma shizhengliae]SCI10583.1 GtrA-like protein [uncultured Collinsella sp.]